MNSKSCFKYFSYIFLNLSFCLPAFSSEVIDIDLSHLELRYASSGLDLSLCSKDRDICRAPSLSDVAMDINDLHMVKSLEENSESSFFIPLSIENQELIKLAIASGLGLVIFSQDEELMEYIDKNRTKVSDKIFDIADLFGLEAPITVAFGSYLVGAVMENEEIKQLGLITLSTGLAVQILTESTKHISGRVRPKHGEGAYQFGRNSSYSFFSGHSAAAWSLATVFSELYSENHPWIPYVSYPIAALTSYARVYKNQHWSSDVVIGAAIGHFVTKAMVRGMLSDDPRQGGFSIVPSYDEEGAYHIKLHYSQRRPIRKPKCNQDHNMHESLRARACIEEAFLRSARR